MANPPKHNPFAGAKSLGGSSYKSDPKFEASDAGRGQVWAIESCIGKETKNYGFGVFLSLVCLNPGDARIPIGSRRSMAAMGPMGQGTAGAIAAETIGRIEACAARIPRQDDEANEAIRAACALIGIDLPKRFAALGDYEIPAETEEAVAARNTVLGELYSWAYSGEGANLAAASHKDGKGIFVLDVGTKEGKPGTKHEGKVFCQFYANPLDLGVDAEGNAAVGPVTEALAKAIVDGTIPAALAKSVLSAGFIANCATIVGADTAVAS